MGKKRYGYLDFLKIAATLPILFMHYQQMMEVVYPTGMNYSGGSFNWGNVVEFFFVISGFVMYPVTLKILSGEESCFEKFMLKRLRRFAPMMFVTALCYEIISYILVFRFGDQSKWCCISIWGIVQRTLCLDSGWGMLPMTLNVPTWYICELMFCYVLMYFAARLCGKHGKSPVTVYAALIILGVAVNTRNIDLPLLTSEMGRGYSAFFTGVILAGLFDRYEMHGVVQLGFSVIIIALTVSGFIIDTASVTFLLCPALIILFSAPHIERLFSGRFWTTLGKIQFHVYIWHAVILLGMRLLGWMGFTPDYNSRLMMYAFAVLAELWGAFSYFVIEKRAEKALLMLIPKKKEKTAETC